MVDRRRRVIKVQSVVCSLEESTFDKKRETTKKRARGERRALLGGRPQRWRDARRANAGNTSDFWTTRKEVAKDSSSLRRLCDDDDAIQKHPEFVTKPPLKMNSIERDTNNNNNNNERTSIALPQTGHGVMMMPLDGADVHADSSSSTNVVRCFRACPLKGRGR